MEIFKLDLPVYEKMVLLYIREIIAAGHTALPSYETIASRCSMSLRKAKMAVKALVSLGLLDKFSRFDDGVQQSNEYVISNDVIKSAPDAPASNKPSAPDAPNKDFKSFKREEDKYTYIPSFESEISKYNIPDFIRRRILTEASDLLTKVWPDAIYRTFKKAMLRQRYGTGIANFSAWFRTTLENEQFYLEQQKLRHV